MLVAANIAATLCGEPTRPFVYRSIGALALVGRHVGVAEIYGWPVSGLLAWAMWRAVYLAKMPSLGQRARILADWWRDARAGGGPAAGTINTSTSEAAPVRGVTPAAASKQPVAT